MVGQIVYESGSYQEVIELESGNTRLVNCSGGGYAPLYRVEYFDEHGYFQHAAFPEYPPAEVNFNRRAEGASNA